MSISWPWCYTAWTSWIHQIAAASLVFTNYTCM
jgi:hypothetical protein